VREAKHIFGLDPDGAPPPRPAIVDGFAARYQT
jgi:hypothetical protein